MSRPQERREWGPSHQHRPLPGSGRRWVKLGAITLVLIFCELLGARLGRSAHDPFGSTIHTMAAYGLIGGVLFLLGTAIPTGRLRLPGLHSGRSPATRLSERIARAP